jgi:hypothetical protein
MFERHLSEEGSQEKASLRDGRNRITYDLYDHEQIEEVITLAEQAPPKYATDDAQRAIYAAFKYLGPLNDDELKKMTVVSTPGVMALSYKEQAEMLTRAITMSRDPNPEPSMLVLDPGAKEKKIEDGERTVVLPFLTGSRKVWIIKDDYGNPENPEGVPPQYREGVVGRYLVTCLLPEEY